MSDDDRTGRWKDICAALADPTRVRILGALAEADATCTDLADRLQLPVASMAHHLAKLVVAGLVQPEIDGHDHRFRLDLTQFRTAIIQPRPPVSEGEDARLLHRFFDGDRLTQIPASRKKRLVVLRHLLQQFEPGQDYPERQVNDMLRPAHEDVATLRRELVDNGFMVRQAGIYRRASEHMESG